MLHYSFATVYMAVLTSTIMIGIIAACFHSKKILLSIGYKLIGIFLILTLVRFAFPFELPFTKTVILPEKISWAITRIRHVYTTWNGIDISIWFFLECVWFVGFICAAVNVVRSNILFNRYVRRYGVDVTEKEPYFSALNRVCDNYNNKTKVFLVPRLDTPRQKGFFHPVILLPQELTLSEMELYYTMYHEHSHCLQKDYLIKLGMNLLVAIYWWNPLSYVLRNQVDVLLEMKVDEKLIASAETRRTDYLATLLHIGEQIVDSASKKKYLSYLNSSPAVKNADDLSMRVHVMYKQEKVLKPLYIGLLGVMSALFVCSYLFIYEARYIGSPATEGAQEVSLTEMHAVPLEDGTYDIYWGDMFVENVDTLEYHGSIQVIDK